MMPNVAAHRQRPEPAVDGTDDLRKCGYGIAALFGRACMAGDALCVQPEPGLALVGDLNGAVRRLGIEHIVVGSNDAVGNELIRADHDVLFVHRGDEQKVMLQLFAHGSNVAKRQHAGCEAGLHIARAAAIHPAVDDLGCQRVMVPAVAERDGVLMADVDQTRAALLTLECGDDTAHDLQDREGSKGGVLRSELFCPAFSRGSGPAAGHQ